MTGTKSLCILSVTPRCICLATVDLIKITIEKAFYSATSRLAWFKCVIAFETSTSEYG